MPSLQFGVFVHGGDLGTLRSKLREKLLANVGVRHFTAAEAHRDLQPVAVQARNFCAFFSLALKSFSPMPGDMRISLISMMR